MSLLFYSTKIAYSTGAYDILRTSSEIKCKKKPVLHKDKKGDFMQQPITEDGVHTIERDHPSHARPKREGIKRTLSPADALVFFVGMILGRTHLFFSAYPLGIAFVACLPHHTFIGLGGAVIGALTNGRSGILFAMIAFITLFVRIIISGAEKHTEGGGMFREGLLLRVSAGAIGGFVAAVYELLLRGITTESVLFSLTMIFGVGIGTGLFGMLFFHPVSLRAVLIDGGGVLEGANDPSSKRRRISFVLSALSYLAALCYGLSAIELLSVNLGGIFLAIASLFVAKRFGAVSGSIVGFLGGLVISPAFAVAGAIVGGLSGVLFPYGNIAAPVGATMAMAAWGIYTEGIVGLFSLLPEGVIGALLAYPILVRISRNESSRSNQNVNIDQQNADDMVRTMYARIARGASESGTLARTGEALERLSALLVREEGGTVFPSESEYRDVLSAAMETRCKTCAHFEECNRSTTAFYHSAPSLLSLLLAHRAPLADDAGDCADRERSEEFIHALSAAVARMEEEAFRDSRTAPLGEVVRTVSEIAKGACSRLGDDLRENEVLTARVREAVRACGFLHFSARVLGSARPRILLAARDEDGAHITASSLTEALADACEGFALDTPRYYRRDAYVLADIGVRPRLRVKCATAVLPYGTDGISGDVLDSFLDEEGGNLYAMLCDGTGSGAGARQSARFVRDFIENTLNPSLPTDKLLRLLDEIVRRKSPEASSTLDLFVLDLVRGNAEFYKLGAVSSFIKRGESLFSIRARSLPLGISDAPMLGERISASVEVGDAVILLSDGVCADPENTPWFLELLAGCELRDPKRLAEAILDGAKKAHGIKDDMSCLVCMVEV